ncbi:hypothetical protein SAMN06275492_14714 [Dethiosulfovibrio salsuginis]|uniref:Uncharacterized protein n=1 Tax=Dethiosulfovibrio salsuginis TaxID=561720 RepID=A0A1X7L4S0_9BACT|nr:hypothetical protein SAMN06275492_14714 [Dethiosulfovibrio salsuginis]
MLKIRFSVARKVGLAMVPILLGLAVAVTIPAWRMFSDVFVEQAEDQARMGAMGLLETIESESIRYFRSRERPFPVLFCCRPGRSRWSSSCRAWPWKRTWPSLASGPPSFPPVP